MAHFLCHLGCSHFGALLLDFYFTENIIDGFYEECFKTNKEIPMVMIVRLKKVKRDTLQ